MDVTCNRCRTVARIHSGQVPIGRSYVICPRCRSRIDIFKGLRVGHTVTNLAGLRYMVGGDAFDDKYCEPGELWRVVEVVEPCPDRGQDKPCETENHGRCPNQRLLLRLSGDRILHKTCLYRKGKKIFELETRMPVGNVTPSTGSMLLRRPSEKEEEEEEDS